MVSTKLLLLSVAAAAIDSAIAATSSNYDFIVVGGGTAGLAVASRLSTSLPDSQILVIEAGAAAPNEPGINIPGLKGSTLFGQYDWSFLTTPQKSAGDRVIGLSRGKVLGGSSALNFMVWNRASKPEYDAWEQLGNHGWNWNSFKRAMLKVENFARDWRYGKDGVAEGGPIQTVINRIEPEQQKKFIPTLKNMGIPGNLESLNGNPLGVMYQPNSIRKSNYTRSYSVEYLKLAGSNLDVMTETSVKKINLQRRGSKWVATGVTLADGSIISARKEVILSAGSLHSPALLEVSGIGNPTILSAAGIPTKIKVPGVGENLQDHLYITTSFRLKPGFKSFDEINLNATFASEQMALYTQGKPSIFDYDASTYMFGTWNQIMKNTSSIVSAAKSSAQKSSVVDQKKLSWILNPSLNNKVPQLEIFFADGYTGTKGYPAKESSLYGSQFFSFLGILQHNFARGSVHINTTSPSAALPILNPNYLSTQYDVKALAEIGKYMRKIGQTAPLKDVIVEEYEPGVAVETDEQWADYAINTASTTWHPLGTCAMLPLKDGGVVDSKLVVHGTSNLRVVDASIIPVLVSAHLQTAAYGIGEKAAEIIAAKWK